MGPGRRGTKQASLLWSMALGSIGSAVLFPGSRARAQQLWCTGLVPPRHVGSSWVRGRTGVPCKADLNHWTTREAHPLCFNYYGLIVILLSGKTSASPMFFFIYVFPVDRTFSWFKHTKIWAFQFNPEPPEAAVLFHVCLFSGHVPVLIWWAGHCEAPTWVWAPLIPTHPVTHVPSVHRQGEQGPERLLPTPDIISLDCLEPHNEPFLQGGTCTRGSPSVPVRRVWWSVPSIAVRKHGLRADWPLKPNNKRPKATE